MADTQPLAPTDAEIENLGHRMCWRYKHSTDPNHSSTYTFNRLTLLDFARAVLAKWGAQPVPAGYALVPVEPTSAMLDAAANAGMTALDEKDAGAEDINMIPRMYGAMLAAAPQPVVREPLTDEQIRELWSTRSLHALEFARVIESAHGISPAQEAN